MPAVHDLSDFRQSDTSDYEFRARGARKVRVAALLVCRRAFRDLTKWKGWQDPDIVMQEESVTLRPAADRRAAAAISRRNKCSPPGDLLVSDQDTRREMHTE